MSEQAPPAYDEKNTSTPPSYVPAQQPVTYQPVQAQPTVIIQPQQPQVIYTTQPNVIVAGGVKEAPCYEAYNERCPYCNVQVVTNVRYEWGSTTWCYLIISLIICWPLIYAICCECSKDAYHYCPRCTKLLAVKRR